MGAVSDLSGVDALGVIRGGSDGRCERLVRSGLKAAQVINQVVDQQLE